MFVASANIVSIVKLFQTSLMAHGHDIACPVLCSMSHAVHSTGDPIRRVLSWPSIHIDCNPGQRVPTSCKGGGGASGSTLASKCNTAAFPSDAWNTG